ncbi:hypothetical protein [Priestia megaterium]|uniref:hypothetical protein n=2 Tax=Priestia megaterium TaxID=1404 RepID=UPI00048EDE75|nr:hypothetical protein [Priestia megaterium]RCX28717.1 hypothetical protein DEU47_101269 [Bacillus sp. AG236]MDC7722815.1 hypothetical protein [Priestia megaterium]MEE3892266.1 hypothetical protein [Priestia megaterium]PFJ98591.1 hypothetical protein COI96_22865 [Priestia megaterium]PFK92759.1 hypothetical protein COJ01_27850 [Priestia megaterium]
MDTNQLPKRSETHKSKKNSPQLPNILALGVFSILFKITPEHWKSPWTSILIVILTSYIAIKFEEIKISLKVKWIIIFIIYAIGFVLYIS